MTDERKVDFSGQLDPSELLGFDQLKKLLETFARDRDPLEMTQSPNGSWLFGRLLNKIGGTEED